MQPQFSYILRHCKVCPWFGIHPVKSKSHLMTEPVESGENRISRSKQQLIMIPYCYIACTARESYQDYYYY
jgi:hypothetical protein